MGALDFFAANIPCPVHANAGLYVAAIADGDDELAYLTARLLNPVASLCGWVCGAPCEDVCGRGEIDEPIAIRSLKRFVKERHGVEADPAGLCSYVAAPPAQFHRYECDYDRIERVEVPTTSTDRRIGLAKVESGISEERGRCEASRCLRCFANIVLETWVLCALCSDVCPIDLIALIPSEEITPKIVAGTALTLDKRACVRCGLCIEQGPTNALSMGVWSGVGVPVEVGAMR